MNPINLNPNGHHFGALEYNIEKTMRELTPLLSKLDVFKRASVIVRQAAKRAQDFQKEPTEGEMRFFALKNLVRIFGKDENLKAARALAREIKDPFEQAKAWLYLKNLENATSVAKGMGNSPEKDQILKSVDHLQNNQEL